MAIANVVARDGMLYIYDEHGSVTGVISCGSNSSLRGFTASKVSVETDSTIYLYDANGARTGAA